uniref:tRNA-binding domain-containing protein n=1 Tax=Globisporangium ultimum (strain ATCC 200006 / CBS 805.95 / DAOM BR144) TaxID=431595 RepID=K3WLT4_GLOUD
MLSRRIVAVRAPLRRLHATRFQWFSGAAGADSPEHASSEQEEAKPVAQVKKQQPPPSPPTTTWNSLVIGEIVDFHPHPTADRLNVCQVNIGDKDTLLQIICGAPNVRQGARVPVATIGTKLAIKDPASGDIKLVKIKKSKLRGELSQGMICSEAELGLTDESDGILILEDDAPVGSLVADWGSVARRLAKDENEATPASILTSSDKVAQ